MQNGASQAASGLFAIQDNSILRALACAFQAGLIPPLATLIALAISAITAKAVERTGLAEPTQIGLLLTIMFLTRLIVG